MIISYLLTILLLLVVAYTSYTDFKYTKIYNKFLLIVWFIALSLHIVQDTWGSSLQGFVIAFFIFFVIYLFKMTSAGDVKLFSVLGAIVANIQVIGYAFIFFMVCQLVIGVIGLMKQAEFRPKKIIALLKLDLIGFMNKTEPAIQPIRFPAAFFIGASVVLAHVTISIGGSRHIIGHIL